MRERESTRQLGRWGEAQIAQWLRRHGYHLLAAGYRCRFGEIDLISSDGKYICFTEVKLRKSARFGPAGQAVDLRKQQRLRQTALSYLATHPTQLQPRFDVAEVYAPEGTATKNPQINYLKNAF